MKRITLFKFENSGIKISMEIYFNNNDQLIFDGYDIGKSVEEAWGDSDYEYTYTIEPKEVDKLYPLFGIKNSDKQRLLMELKNRFEVQSILKTPEISQADKIIQWGRTAAFMIPKPLDQTTLPISYDTIFDFLNSDDEAESEEVDSKE